MFEDLMWIFTLFFILFAADEDALVGESTLRSIYETVPAEWIQISDGYARGHLRFTYASAGQGTIVIGRRGAGRSEVISRRGLQETEKRWMTG